MKFRFATAGISGALAVGALLVATGGSFVRAQEPRAPATKTVWDGVYTDAQAERGEAAYTKVCSDCHGDDLEVAGDDMSYALAGADFLSNWGGLTAGDLFERIRTTMPEDRPGTLSKATIADVMAYMFRSDKFPAGQSELPNNSTMLKLIAITPKPNVQ